MAPHRERLPVEDMVNAGMVRPDAACSRDANVIAGQPGCKDKGDDRWRCAHRGNDRALAWVIYP